MRIANLLHFKLQGASCSVFKLKQMNF